MPHTALRSPYSDFNEGSNPMEVNMNETLINQIFDIAIARWELETDLGYDSLTIADITKDIIETALKISTEYLEELNRIQ